MPAVLLEETNYICYNIKNIYCECQIHPTHSYQGDDRLEINRSISNGKIYIGSLQYQNTDYQFVFFDAKLQLIPLDKSNRLSMWKFRKKEITNGVYTWDEPPRMEEEILTGICYESGQPIVFLPKKGSYISRKNAVLFIDLRAYIICKYSRNSIDRISFSSPEIDCIHPATQALEYTLDIQSFINNGTFSISGKDFEYTTTSKQFFVVDTKTISVSFGISRGISTHIGEPPITLCSNMLFEFDAITDFTFILRLWHIAKQFIQFLCYRKNIQFRKIELDAPCEDGNHETFAELYVLDQNNEPEIEALNDGRYIKQTYISDHEGQILSDIANDNLYLRHLPESFRTGKHIDAARFVMITAAFEWEFDRLLPGGITKSKQRIDAELAVSQKIKELADASSGKQKDIYKSLLKSISRAPSLANKIQKVGSELGSIIDPFGKRLYSLNKELLNYTDIGNRVADQRNHFAHGDLDKDFIGLSLLDLIFLQRIIYAMQLKISGLEDKQIQKSINDLFQYRFII